MKTAGLTMEQLLAKQQEIQNDPKSKNPRHAYGSIFIYTREANAEQI